MADFPAAAAAAPPRIPTPPKVSTPALLPAPSSTRRLVPQPPASRAPPESQKPGRASASQSWVRDKAERRVLGKIPGRASLSDSWVADKLLPSTAPRGSSLCHSFVETKLPAASPTPARAPSRGVWNGGCGKRSCASSSAAGKSGKKARYESSASVSDESDSDSGPELYAGPAFIKAPHPVLIGLFPLHRI